MGSRFRGNDVVFARAAHKPLRSCCSKLTPPGLSPSTGRSVAAGRTGLNHLEDISIINPVLLHPAHCPNVGEALSKPAPSAVLGFSAQARMVSHRHLCDAEAAHLKEGRQKPMHALIKLQSLQTFTPVGLQRASRINDVVACHPVSKAVRDARGDALPERIVAADTDAADRIPFAEHPSQARYFCGIVLEISVDRHHRFPACQLESRSHGSGLAEVTAKVRDADAHILLPGFFEQRQGPIGASVVHKKYFDLSGHGA